MGGYIWLILTVVFAFAEVAAPGLVAIWFALAAGILTLISRFIENPLNEIYLFIGMSFFFILVTRPISKKILGKRKYKIEDRIIGQIVTIESLVPPTGYEVKLDGKYWKAVCSQELKVGDRAKVLKIEGIKLILEKE